MEVIVSVVLAEDLQVAITETKKAGKRILALSPESIESPRGSNKKFLVKSYTLVVQ